MPVPVTIRRNGEIDQILGYLVGAHCVSIVGLSNMGKSTLMRSLSDPSLEQAYAQTTGRDVLLVYVDCNGMLEMSGQGFYELILRAVQNMLNSPPLLERVGAHYQKVVEPDSQFMVPLSFNRALTDIIEAEGLDLILLLDEFDEVFDTLDGRVFLNLRHLKDKYPLHLIYVTATVRRLGSKRMDDQTAEFVELSAPFTYILKPLTRPEADELAFGLAEYAGVADSLSERELQFLWVQAGGHPRLLRAAVSQLAELYHRTESGGPLVDDLHNMVDYFNHDMIIRSEITRLWAQLGPDERGALTDIQQGDLSQISPRTLLALAEWGLVREQDTQPVVFADLLADFIRRQVHAQEELPGGVYIDSDAGEVWVEGVASEVLTELEFRLIELLFRRRNKITDKYQIVETVWGVDYIDDVDDARIEKLVSRLRAKVEPDSSNPRYIITVRGRGYKLIS